MAALDTVVVEPWTAEERHLSAEQSLRFAAPGLTTPTSPCYERFVEMSSANEASVDKVLLHFSLWTIIMIWPEERSLQNGLMALFCSSVIFLTIAAVVFMGTVY